MLQRCRPSQVICCSRNAADIACCKHWAGMKEQFLTVWVASMSSTRVASEGVDESRCVYRLSVRICD